MYIYSPVHPWSQLSADSRTGGNVEWGWNNKTTHTQAHTHTFVLHTIVLLTGLRPIHWGQTPQAGAFGKWNTETFEVYFWELQQRASWKDKGRDVYNTQDERSFSDYTLCHTRGHRWHSELHVLRVLLTLIHNGQRPLPLTHSFGFPKRKKQRKLGTASQKEAELS